jgi:hypothetical protein
MSLRAIKLSKNNLDTILANSDITRDDLTHMVEEFDNLVFIPNIEAPDGGTEPVWASVPETAFDEYFNCEQRDLLDTQLVEISKK